jgi:ethanolamine ammonia-lyase large subunit
MAGKAGTEVATREKLEIPTQSCVLAHVTTTLGLIQQGAPVDLVFQ